MVYNFKRLDEWLQQHWSKEIDYKDIVCEDNPKKDDFNWRAYQLFQIQLMSIYVVENSWDKMLKDIHYTPKSRIEMPVKYDQESGFGPLYEVWYKMDKYDYQRIWSSFFSYVMHTRSMHLPVNSCVLYGGERGPSNDGGIRIYLPVKNENLHEFAFYLLSECDAQMEHYEFKINDSSDLKRSDNVVIYAQKEEFSEYIRIIEEIRKKYPELKFGQVPILSYNYNEYIGIAPGSDHSYNWKMMNELNKAKEKSISREQWIKNVHGIIERELREVEIFSKENPDPRIYVSDRVKRIEELKKRKEELLQKLAEIDRKIEQEGKN